MDTLPQHDFFQQSLPWDSPLSPEKQCTKCKRSFLATMEYFYHDKNRKDGLFPQCKICKNPPKTNDNAIEPGYKRCPKCNNVYPATTEHFHRHKRTKDGLYGYCKQCKIEETKAYQREHREELRNRKAEYRASHREERKRYREARREEFLAYNHRYYAEHREGISEQRKVYYQEHQEHLRQYSAQYRLEHPGEVRQYNSRYNASERRKVVAARYRATHREELRQGCSRWHTTHREQQKQYRVIYNVQHREERLAYYMQRRAQCREELNARHRAYRRTERGRMVHRMQENSRRAQKLAVPGTLTPDQIQYKLKAQKYRCYYAMCGHAKFQKVNGKYIFHLEHTIPLSRPEAGPRHDVDYVVLSCPSCNLRKNNKLPHEFWEGGRLF